MWKDVLLTDWYKAKSDVPVGCTGRFTWYALHKIPMEIFPVLQPVFQLEFGRTTSLPFVSASNCGLPGLWQDLVLLTDSMHGRKMMQQAAISFTNDNNVLNHLKCGVINLCFVTQFNLSFCELSPQQLEQVAFECPNLQQLNIQHNEHCFRNLRGLHAIASVCHNLKGLNMMDI